MTLCHGSLKFQTSRGRGNFLTHVASTWGPEPLRGGTRFSGPNSLSNDTRSLGQGSLATLAVVGVGIARYAAVVGAGTARYACGRWGEVVTQGGASLCPGLGSLSPLG
jgi:hypothetical protein